LAAVPASAGVPLTHRGIADTVTLTTAHSADGTEPDYDRLVAAAGTLVLFMGLGRLPELVRGLVAAGMPPATPAAVVSRGTRPDERTVSAPLDGLAEAAQGLPAPALVVIGEVVSLRARLAAGRERAVRPARARA
jgi:siroheme synthase